MIYIEKGTDFHASPWYGHTIAILNEFIANHTYS